MQDRPRETVQRSRLGEPGPPRGGSWVTTTIQRCPAWIFTPPSCFVTRCGCPKKGVASRRRLPADEADPEGTGTRDWVLTTPRRWAASRSRKRALGSAPLCSPQRRRLILRESGNPRALATLQVHKYGPLLIPTRVLGLFNH